jgi:hypothetical protein
LNGEQTGRLFPDEYELIAVAVEEAGRKAVAALRFLFRRFVQAFGQRLSRSTRS